MNLFSLIAPGLRLAVAALMLVGLRADDSIPYMKLAEFPLKEAAPGLILPITLGERQVPMLFDSGANAHFFDDSLAPELGAPLDSVSVVTPDGARPYAARRLPEMIHLEHHPLQTERAYLFDSKLLQPAFDEAVKGTLGLSLLRHGCWSFNFDSSTLTLAYKLALPDAGIERFPEDALLRLPVTLTDTVTVPCLLDTGMTGWGMLEAETFDALVKAGVLEISSNTVSTKTTVGQRDDVKQATMRTLQVAGQQCSNATFVRGTRNLLGWKFFTQFNWFIDLSESDVRMQSRKRISAK